MSLSIPTIQTPCTRLRINGDVTSGLLSMAGPRARFTSQPTQVLPGTNCEPVYQLSIWDELGWRSRRLTQILSTLLWRQPMDEVVSFAHPIEAAVGNGGIRSTPVRC